MSNIPINQILIGDVLEKLRELPDECVDTIITSPPYWGLRDYGVEGQLGLEPTIEEYLKKILDITLELKRVLKKTGVMFWDHGDSYCGGHPGGSIHGAITGDRYSDEVIPQQTEGRPQGKMDNYQEKCLIMQNYRLAIKMIDEQGWVLRNTLIWHKPNAMPSSVRDRFKNSYEPVYMFVKSKRYYFDLDAVRIPHKVFGITEERPMGITRQKSYSESKYNKSDDPHLSQFQNKEQKDLFKGTLTKKDVANAYEIAENASLPKYAKGSEFEKKYGEPWDRFGKQTKKFKKQDNVPSRNAPTYKGFNDRYHQSVERYKEVMKDKGGITEHQNYKLTAGLRIKGTVGNSQGKTPSDVMKIPLNQQPEGRSHFQVGKTFHNWVIENFGSEEAYREYLNSKGKNPGDLWEIPTHPFPEAHFATFPEKLIEPMIIATCPKWICKKCGKARTRIIKGMNFGIENSATKYQKGNAKSLAEKRQAYRKAGFETPPSPKTVGWTKCNCKPEKYEAGICLDPFMGSGTVAIVAKKLGMNYIGIELNPEYVKMAKERIKGAPTPLF